MSNYTSFPLPPSAIDPSDPSDPSLHDTYISTAPTTPDGSLTFSPVLHPSKLEDALEVAELDKLKFVKSRSSKGTLRTIVGEAEREGKGGKVRNLCCIGAGYVNKGGPTAAILALQNPDLRVTVLDRDADRIAAWNSRHLPLYEPGLYPIIRIVRDGTHPITIPKAQTTDTSSSTDMDDEKHFITIPARKPNLVFTTDSETVIREADIIMICVNTPTKKYGLGEGKATDMSAVEGVVIEIAKYAKEGVVIVEKSTVPCGTRDMISSIMKTYQPNLQFEVLSNPEFLSASTAIHNLLHPSRILIGSSLSPSGLSASSTLSSIYESWVPKSKILTINTYSSELAKLVANSMLAQRISSINSISAICERTGADVDEVSQAIGMDSRIGPKYLQAGIGFGGSCFRKDILSLTYLAESLGLDEVADYWMGVLKINEWQQKRCVERVVKELNMNLRGKKVTVLGFGFKSGTDDVRESVSLEVIKGLVKERPGEIAVWDQDCGKDKVEEEVERGCGVGVVLRDEKGTEGENKGREVGKRGYVRVYEDVYQACEGAWAVLVLTDKEELRLLPPSISPGSSPEILPLSPSENNVTGTERSGKEIIDPRPFTNPTQTTELEIIALEKYLVSLHTSTSTTPSNTDPLNRLFPEPECENGCQKCIDEKKKMEQVGGMKENVDWARILYWMEGGKLVFDGRGVVCREGVEALGGVWRGVGR